MNNSELDVGTPAPRFCLPDQDGNVVLEEYGVWQLKKMYGREFHGVVRSTFLVDPEGNVAYAWRKVRVKDHVEDVKAKLAELIMEAK